MTRARVTVVVPAHNAAGYVAAAVESVRAQTYTDWELVLADDGSTDGTGKAVAALAESEPARISVVSLNRNVGPALARRAAIDSSSGGELIALLDADDRWRPDYLEVQVAAYEQALREGRRPGIMACDAVVENADGSMRGLFSELNGWVDPIDYDHMIRRSYIFVSALFTRAAYDEVGGFSGECWGSEDYDLWLRIMERGYDVVATREPIAVYRFHPSGLSRNQLTMADAALAAYGRALQRGALTRPQARAVRGRMRHYRALRGRALVSDALRGRRWAEAAHLALRAAPVGIAAVVQSPSRWLEWLTDARRALTKSERARTLA